MQDYQHGGDHILRYSEKPVGDVTTDPFQKLKTRQ